MNTQGVITAYLKLMDRKSVEELMGEEERWCFWNVGQLTVPMYINLVLTDT